VIRAFIAVEIDPQVIDKISAAINQLNREFQVFAGLTKRIFI